MKSMPTAEMPKALERAAEAARERGQELAEAESTLEVAERAVEEGHRLDIEAAATAREAGEADPPQQHEAEARQALTSAERERAIRSERSRMADKNLQGLLAEQAVAWRKKIEASWAKADQALTRKLSEIDAVSQARIELSVAWSWLRAAQQDGDAERTLRKAQSPLTHAGLLDLDTLREEIERGSFERYAERVEAFEREQRETVEASQAEYEERLAEARAAQEGQG
jgi:hypothetical protein